ncbi:dihydrodipicolinate reductase [Sphingomonas tabacisoli]|uniref:Dihydrodipicolinate reductase n=1 Tax=Sphingomonas tabacisoli TaxID=2249466 RepID=A0ABW4I7V6_9SPHN
MTDDRKLRVVQWATGNIGLRSLKAIIEHPRMELAGLWVNSTDKIGRDAGALCGLADTGIKATNAVDEIVALDADCVVHMPQGTDIDLLCRLLASGKNVVTTRDDFHHPPLLPSNVRQRVEMACREGSASLYSTGVSPGFVTEALTVPLLSLSRRLDCLTIDEFGDVSTRASPEMIFGIMGFGEEKLDFDPRRLDHLKANFGSSLAQVAAAAGISVERWNAFGEFGTARQRTEIAAGWLEAGTVAAQRITIEGLRDGRPVLRFRANWYCTRDIEPAGWDLRASGWRIVVEGDTPLEVAISFPVEPEAYAAFTPGLTAHRAVNSVAAVCAAPPGIRTTVDLPQIVARL